MASKTLLSLEQFEQFPDDGMRHELDEGELILLPPPLGRHGRISLEIGVLLRSYIDPRSLGDVFVESGFRLKRDTVRSPDVSLIRAERSRTMDQDQRFEGGPDLAIEVISPSETAADIARKVRQYLSAGTVVWVVYPRDRAVHVFESSGSARVLGADDLLEAPDLMPGFSVRVSRIFA